MSVLSPQLIDQAEATVNAIDRATDAIEDLMDKLRLRGDHTRVARLQTARNRLDDARRIVEESFR